jgi:hypothetical protein
MSQQRFDVVVNATNATPQMAIKAVQEKLGPYAEILTAKWRAELVTQRDGTAVFRVYRQ